MPDEKQIDRIMGMFTDMWKDRKTSTLGELLFTIIEYSKQAEDLEEITDDEVEAFLSIHRQKGWTGLSLEIRKAQKDKERKQEVEKTAKSVPIQGTIQASNRGIRFHDNIETVWEGEYLQADAGDTYDIGCGEICLDEEL